MKYQNIREEELKNKVARDFFHNFDTTEIKGYIDFCIADKETFFGEAIYFFWAEAKKGTPDIEKSIVQLILTIGKARTFDKITPPPFLGAFDFEKIAFIPYADIQDIFYQNDFNWNVTPSKSDTKEFQQILEKVKNIFAQKTLLFNFLNDEKELKNFIKENFIWGKNNTQKQQITKTNFISVFHKWQEIVKPTIAIDWEKVKKGGIIDGYFYLADLLSENHHSLKENLFVVLKGSLYEMNKHINEYGLHTSNKVEFLDKQKAYNFFWNRYERPPKEELWGYMIDRQDLLVPQNIRERKGSYYTPKQWVKLSQKYLADVFGENWQEEYIIWDCAAGTGNLLANLTEKYNIYASTLDQADVDVMKELAQSGDLNLLENHIFQFDFLNDPFDGGKLPQSLLDIINNEEKRKKLIIYINPPYAESGLAKDGEAKKDVQETRIKHKYKKELGKVSRELFAQFLIRIYKEIPNCKLGEFSTLKILQAPNSSDFRKEYRAKLEKIFLSPANTFDNVKGEFPIGFKIWDTEKKEIFSKIEAYVYDKKANFIGTKNIYSYDGDKVINEWIDNISPSNKSNSEIGFLNIKSNDFQHNNRLIIGLENILSRGDKHKKIYSQHLIPACIYFAVRHCIDADWLNDRDQFLYPNDGWLSDTEFQNDCLAFTLFHGQNRISSQNSPFEGRERGSDKGDVRTKNTPQPPSEGGMSGTPAEAFRNHWLPFTESEVDAPERFESHFMTDFIKGKISSSKIENKKVEQLEMFKVENSESLIPNTPLKFSEEATAVFEAGRELWRYYFSSLTHTSLSRTFSKGGKTPSPKERVGVRTPSLYDIRAYFQGRNEKGKMNHKSEDETYNKLIANLREKLKILAEKIQPKVFEYGFLKQ